MIGSRYCFNLGLGSLVIETENVVIGAMVVGLMR